MIALNGVGQGICLNFFGLKDIEEISKLEKATSDYPWTLKNFESSVSCSHICLGCKDNNNHWIAYIVLSLAADEAELLLIGVAKTHQKKGIATQMLTNVIGQLKNRARQLFLEVRENNYSARCFYENFGFNQMGMRDNYYPCANKSSRENAIIYGMDLTVF